MDLSISNKNIKLMSRFYDLKQPGDENNQFFALPNMNKCVCCNNNNVPLIKLQNCSHTSFLETYFGNLINILTAPVCIYCHGLLKKIDDFKKQIEYSVLLSKVTYSSTPIIRLQKVDQNIISINPLHIQNDPEVKKETETVEVAPVKIKQEIDTDISEEAFDTKNELSCNSEAWHNDSNANDGSTNNMSAFSLVNVKTEITDNEYFNVNSLRQEMPGGSNFCEKTEPVEIEVPLLLPPSNWENVDQGMPSIPYNVAPICKVELAEPKAARNSAPSLVTKYRGKIASVQLTQEEVQAERDAKAKDPKYMKQKHKCEQCMVGFTLEETLLNHMKKHDKSNGNFLCSVCECVYATRAALTTHREGHWKRYQCIVCKLKFKQIYICVKHYNEAHGQNGDSLITVYECYKEECDYKSTNFYEYNTHRRREHSKKPECPECGKFFASLANLKRHIECMHHNMKRVYKCDVCDKEYQTFGGLSLHSKSAHNEGVPAYCNICMKQYKNQVILNAHLKTHSTHVADDQMKYICDTCGQKFTVKAQLKAHIEYKHLNIRHKCKECDQSFNFIKTLRTHMRMKHSNKPPPKLILCQFCGVGFKHKMSLRSHIWTHTGERPLQCKRCPASFAHGAALYNHNRMVHKVPKLNNPSPNQ